jgi:hypothetical protein
MSIAEYIESTPHPQESWTCQDGDFDPSVPLKTTQEWSNLMGSEIISYSHPHFQMGELGVTVKARQWEIQD